MDRYIYDYDLYVLMSPRFTHQTMKNGVNRIFDIRYRIYSKLKSFFSQWFAYYRFNYNAGDVKDKKISGMLQEEDIEYVYNKLLARGYLSRDNLIDLEYLKQRTAKRLVFPDVISTGLSLHPITFIYPKMGKPKLISTKDLLSNPLESIN